MLLNSLSSILTPIAIGNTYLFFNKLNCKLIKKILFKNRVGIFITVPLSLIFIVYSMVEIEVL